MSNNPHAVRQDGFAGLYKLAQWCESDDPRLHGISTFVGISPLVPKKLDTCGFTITDTLINPNYYKQFIDYSLRPVYGAMDKFAHLFHDATYRERPTKIATITREKLIEYKQIYQRLAGIAGES